MSKHFEMRYKAYLANAFQPLVWLVKQVMYFNSFDFFKHDYLIALGSRYFQAELLDCFIFLVNDKSTISNCKFRCYYTILAYCIQPSIEHRQEKKKKKTRASLALLEEQKIT